MSENCNPEPQKLLYPRKAVLGPRSRKGASARCCFLGPVAGAPGAALVWRSLFFALNRAHTSGPETRMVNLLLSANTDAVKKITSCPNCRQKLSASLGEIRCPACSDFVKLNIWWDLPSLDALGCPHCGKNLSVASVQCKCPGCQHEWPFKASRENEPANFSPDSLHPFSPELASEYQHKLRLARFLLRTKEAHGFRALKRGLGQPQPI